MTISFEISRTGNDFSCRADGGPRFFVGRRVPFDGRIGLFNIFAGSPLVKLPYRADDFRAGVGFWADVIEPTALCEGRNFLTLNTYDRAAFTFGFGQFAAHVPDGDFVRYLRALLALPQAADYVSSLALVGGRIVHDDLGPLETATSTAPLMTYLNPRADEVDDSEVIAAARLIHWTTNHVDARTVQVEQMIAAFRRSLRRAATKVALDGRPGDQCCVIADILHHGRGGSMTFQLIRAALGAARPFDQLVAIGAPVWATRKATLKAAILARPQLAARRWNTAAADFA